MGTTIEKQGIVSILTFDADQTKVPSLRRTLSEDLYSKKWLDMNEISPMKKIASSEEITNLVEGQFDVWSSIVLSKKVDDESSKFSPPYVHPLVKKSTSALSEKSLKICTESLGSETGSEVFSSYASSLSDDAEEDKEEMQTQQQQPQTESVYFYRDELRAAKYNYSKKVSLKSFPPPLPSLARFDGSSLHMHSHRENGRLVLEAVSVPTQDCFHAQRQDGRLVLTFANTPDSKEPSHEETIDQEVIQHAVETIEDEKDFKDQEEEEEIMKDENEDGGKEIELVMEQSGMINVRRSGFMIKNLMEDNRSPIWSNKYDKAVHFMVMEEEDESNPPEKSLPLSPRLSSLIPSPPVNSPNKNSCNRVILSNSSTKACEERGVVLLRGNMADYLVPMLRGCEEPRSLLIWKPYCIATS